MEMDEMKELVIQASQTFYGTQDKEQRRLAEEWLDNFKKSTHAWYITDQILHTVKNEQVLFFAAQTIRTKIQYNFHELPADSHEVNILSTTFSFLLERVLPTFCKRLMGRPGWMKSKLLLLVTTADDDDDDHWV